MGDGRRVLIGIAHANTSFELPDRVILKVSQLSAEPLKTESFHFRECVVGLLLVPNKNANRIRSFP